MTAGSECKLQLAPCRLKPALRCAGKSWDTLPQRSRGVSPREWSFTTRGRRLKPLPQAWGEIRLGPGAVLRYQEAHYHGPAGEIQVIPRATVILERGARYLAEFSLLEGRVGRLDRDQRMQVGEEAVAELVSRVYGQGSDQIRICEQVCLDGAGARGLVKTRVAVREQARAEVLSHMEGNAAGARGHLDYMEVVRDQAVVSAITELRVSHPQAKLTHEAAIGSVDSRQLETLMARGLDPDEAVDVIVRGMLA